MKKKIFFILIITAVITAILLFFLVPKKNNYKKTFQFTTVEKGSIKTVVSCTGTINAKGTVDVGTQVSGTIAKVYVDFNDKVKKNQVLAKIDTTLLEIEVKQAEAALVKAKSQYEYDLQNYKNYKTLYEEQLISEMAFKETKVTKDSSYAAMVTAENTLNKAKSNLGYAIIRSPINGTVINRDVEEGQTVAASYSTPTLFSLAKDLSNMEIQALVDENDIGKIKVNQNVDFTVDAYPEEEFTGVVRQIRLEPTTVSNVVNYYVIIDTKNEKSYLLPGMTATIDIIIQERNDILLVKNSALKFKPTFDMIKDSMKDMPPKDKNFKDGQNPPTGNSEMPMQMPNKMNFKDKNVSEVWIVDSENKLKPIFVNTGITDGQKTEILENKNIEEGLSVITGSTSTEEKSSSNTKNNNKNIMGGPGGPPPMF